MSDSKRIIVTTENIERTFDADRFTYDGQGWLEVRKGSDDPVIVALFSPTKWESVHLADSEVVTQQAALAELDGVRITPEAIDAAMKAGTDYTNAHAGPDWVERDLVIAILKAATPHMAG